MVYLGEETTQSDLLRKVVERNREGRQFIRLRPTDLLARNAPSSVT